MPTIRKASSKRGFVFRSICFSYSLLFGSISSGCSGSDPGTNAGAGGNSGSGNTIADSASAKGGAFSSGGSLATGGLADVGPEGTDGGSVAIGDASLSGGTTGEAGSGGGGFTTGGIEASGGVTAGGAGGGGFTTGGTEASGGITGSGGASDYRCDVGVYDAANPPASYAITGGRSVHDPTVILVDDVYYSANTGLSLWTRSSTDLTRWTNIKQALGGTNPSWIKAYVPDFNQQNGDLWAPDFSYFGGRYHLYYAASTFGENTSCLGHATRAAMNTGSWSDDGGPLLCSNSAAFGSYTNVNWNAIDPSIVLDESGSPWLVFGSSWNGIHIVRLTSAGTVDNSSPITNIARRSGPNVVENAYMVRRCGYYYLFMSWDRCCAGARSTYNIRVGRSTNMTEGFVDKDGVALLNGGGTKIMGDGNGWVGPGGQTVVFNGTRAYLVYHAYDASASGNVFAMHVSDLYWDSDGWPITTSSP